MPTRAQERLEKAYTDVSQVLTDWGPAKDRDGNVADVDSNRYGGLCHKVPVLIRTCGLCQAVAFMESKKAKEKSHERMLQHIASILGVDAGELATAVAQMPTVEYMHKTRLLLEALLYYKRFAVSILKTEADSGGEQE